LNREILKDWRWLKCFW